MDTILNSLRCIKRLIAPATLLQKIVTKLDKEMDAQEVKNWTQRIEIVKIMNENENQT